MKKILFGLSLILVGIWLSAYGTFYTGADWVGAGTFLTGFFIGASGLALAWAEFLIALDK